MVFHLCLSDSKSTQISRIILSILADLSNAVVWILLTLSLIYKSLSPCTNPLVTVSSTPVTIGITVTFMFHSFFYSFLARFRYLSLFLLSFSFTRRSVAKAKSAIWRFSFLLAITRSGRLAEIRWSVCISKSRITLCVPFSRTNLGLCI